MEKTENVTFNLEKLNPEQLPELKGLKEKQLQIVEENPFVEITDNATFEAAKKARTTLKTARTDIEKQDKTIASKIKKFREMVASIHGDLISITKPHEEKQQEEVDRYEAVKENERLEKIRLENERIEKIKNNINYFYSQAISKIAELSFESIEALKIDFEANLYSISLDQFQEFSTHASEKLEEIKIALSDKEVLLNKLEEQRLEAERLKAEKLKLENEQKAFAEKERLAKEEAEAEKKRIQHEQKEQQDKIDAERKKFKEEQEAAQQKINAEREENERLREQLQSELKAKKDAEEKTIVPEKKVEVEVIVPEEKVETIQKEVPPLKTQFYLWVNEFSISEIPADLEDNEKAQLIKEKFNSFKKWATSQIESI